ncbi:DUF397 domain-containing protein [Nocardiopsis suaedae]|uniref:DUF397 domain-containing protein n=1 Tax=Nocardiopsis suaedae TaxID=3018444 RepID=A0ABT4TKB1_9ACTN|nr:DUF397 domain-containing protein [Nocardiopsis suaedae]MDA2804694.1 DUF397 domain-containing protein [Nocardiopsis suaedae]
MLSLSYSGGGAQNCVEVASLSIGAAVRDSKHPDAGHLAFPAPEWSSFLAGAVADRL